MPFGTRITAAMLRRRILKMQVAEFARRPALARFALRLENLKRIPRGTVPAAVANKLKGGN